MDTRRHKRQEASTTAVASSRAARARRIAAPAAAFTRHNITAEGAARHYRRYVGIRTDKRLQRGR